MYDISNRLRKVETYEEGLHPAMGQNKLIVIVIVIYIS